LIKKIAHWKRVIGVRLRLAKDCGLPARTLKDAQFRQARGEICGLEARSP